MATLVFPTTPRPSRSEFGLVANTQVFVSPLNKARQTLELPGALWVADLLFSDLKNGERATLKSFLVSLRGAAGRFTLWDHTLETPRGAASATPGTPLVAGAGQTGVALNIDGAPANATGYLLVADYFEVNGELKMVTAQVDTDGAGAATIAFEPALVAAPADNAALNFTRASATFMLVDDNQSRWRNRAILSSFAISAVEAF